MRYVCTNFCTCIHITTKVVKVFKYCGLKFTFSTNLYVVYFIEALYEPINHIENHKTILFISTNVQMF